MTEQEAGNVAFAVSGASGAVGGTVFKLTCHAPMTRADFLRRHPESYRHLVDA